MIREGVTGGTVRGGYSEEWEHQNGDGIKKRRCEGK